MRQFAKQIFLLIWGIVGCIVIFNAQTPTKVAAQQPTGSIATVTSTPIGAYIIVNFEEQINVRAGPSSYEYPSIGVLLPLQQAPARGVSKGGDWIQIVYMGVPGNVGWVYAPLVELGPPGVILKPVDAPPTPTPIATVAIDPTLAAEYLDQVTPTRLATFTPPPALALPTYSNPSSSPIGVPMGFIILVLFLVGLFGSFISFLRAGR